MLQSSRARQRALSLCCVICSSLFSTVAGWHAWVEYSPMPDLNGTNLFPSLRLPAPSELADPCKIAITSLRKLTQGDLCWASDQCDLKCATAFGSLIRDVKNIYYTKCAVFDQEATSYQRIVYKNPNYQQPSSEQYSDTFSRICTRVYGCAMGHCSPSANVVESDGTSSSPLYISLAPSSQDCSNFVIPDDTNSLPFLTWHSLHLSYRQYDKGCSGSLGSLADAEHTTWSCIHQPGCTRYMTDDMACFKYSFVRGEFHFWNWNSVLRLMPPLFPISLKFCNSTMKSVLFDAMTGQELPRNGTVLSMEYVLANNAVENIKRGALNTIGLDACQEILSIKYRTVRMSLERAGYYFYTKTFTITNVNKTISAAMYPVMQTPTRSGLAVVLEWCDSPSNLDLWLVFPSTVKELYSCAFTTGNVTTWSVPSQKITSESTCVSKGGQWKKVTRQEGNMAEDDEGPQVSSSAYALPDGAYALYMDGPRHVISPCPAAQSGCSPGEFLLQADSPVAFGSASVQVNGNLPTGSYRMYAVVRAQSTFETFQGSCDQIYATMYSETSLVRAVYQVQAGAATTGDSLKRWWHVLNIKVFTDNLQRSCSSLEVVDTFVDGYLQIPVAPLPILSLGVGSVKSTIPMLCFDMTQNIAMEMQLFYFRIRSARDYGIIQSSSYEISGPNSVLLSSGSSDSDGAAGILLASGSYNITLRVPQYISRTFCFTMDRKKKLLNFFLSPADLRGRIVFNWGSQYPELSFFILPIGTSNNWYDVDSNLQTYAGPSSTLISVASAKAEVEACSLHYTKSIYNETMDVNEVINGSCSLSLYKAVEGQYRIYVEIPPMDSRTPVFRPSAPSCESLRADVYIKGSYVTSVSYQLGYAKWWMVGYFYVNANSDYTWIANSQSIYNYNPLTVQYYPVQLTIKDAVKFSSRTDFTNLQYKVWLLDSQQEAACQSSSICGKTCQELFEMYGRDMCQLSYQQVAQKLDNVSCDSLPAQGLVRDRCTTLCSFKPCSSDRVVAVGTAGLDKRPCNPSSAVQSCPDSVWTQFTSSFIYLPAGSYDGLFTIAGYVDRNLFFSVTDSSLQLVVVMVPLPAPHTLRVVLTWGATPLDLDLWVIANDGGDPATGGIVYWDDKGPNRGIQLDVDAVSGFGPETITFGLGAQEGIYKVAVNVYINRGETFQQFKGNETVEFYDSSGLILRSIMPVRVRRSSWWLVGLVEVKNVSSWPTYTINTTSHVSRANACHVTS
ncbi:hypothetical protein GUITHDRAFT_115491 [Guillardia theta CCMP2712]|uniref:Uncharacterized protein n=1 Tax=Guillardia theta (strain CCMP2712) TaxID=905079 RepID=L1IQ29_GUITC|nr:hypothetical protein GUITHDRAFT_115491 [Guillardia theta CCMP2712]EKX38348.1 hypothetical protein GUITHDRAFT_115491 [Guillardia theta CCMP2712]|eukprot:XP_005825328.1 hypothetical protein GUITHDRAFT_115491 [Guillardia theta CCMP2712]